MSYKLVKVLGDEVVVLQYPDKKVGSHIWTTVKIRKAWACVACRQNFYAGSLMWSPLSSKINRADRMCDRCIRKLPNEQEV